MKIISAVKQLKGPAWDSLSKGMIKSERIHVVTLEKKAQVAVKRICKFN